MGWGDLELAVVVKGTLVVDGIVRASIVELNTALLKREGEEEAHLSWANRLRWIGLRLQLGGNVDFLAR